MRALIVGASLLLATAFVAAPTSHAQYAGYPSLDPYAGVYGPYGAVASGYAPTSGYAVSPYSATYGYSSSPFSYGGSSYGVSPYGTYGSYGVSPYSYGVGGSLLGGYGASPLSYSSYNPFGYGAGSSAAYGGFGYGAAPYGLSTAGGTAYGLGGYGGTPYGYASSAGGYGYANSAGGLALAMPMLAVQGSVVPALQQRFPTASYWQNPPQLLPLQGNTYAVSSPLLFCGVDQAGTCQLLAQQLAEVSPGWGTTLLNGPQGYGVYLTYQPSP